MIYDGFELTQQEFQNPNIRILFTIHVDILLLMQKKNSFKIK